MGFFGSDNDQSAEEDKSTLLLNDQIQQNSAEIERKRQDLFRQRIDIIKSGGRENWGTPAIPTSPGSPMGKQ